MRVCLFLPSAHHPTSLCQVSRRTVPIDFFFVNRDLRMQSRCDGGDVVQIMDISCARFAFTAVFPLTRYILVRSALRHPLHTLDLLVNRFPALPNLHRKPQHPCKCGSNGASPQNPDMLRRWGIAFNSLQSCRHCFLQLVILSNACT